MRLFAAIVAVSLLGAGTAQADWFKGRKLPRPIDSPVVRLKVQESHKPGKKQRHPPGPSPFTSILPPVTVERA